MRTALLVLTTLVLTLTAAVTEVTAPASRYVKARVLGVPVNIVYVNLDNPKVRVTAAISRNGIGSREPFKSFVERTAPAAAINGTFFSKSNSRPVGDIVVNGRCVHFGGMGSGICITAENKVSFVTVEWGRHKDWSGYKTVICCGPMLVRNGEAGVDAYAEGFRDPHVLNRGVRTAVGVTNRNRLVLLNTLRACSLNELAKVMKEIGCTDAVNFDGGASTAMYYKGRYVTRPGREITNVLLVYER